MHSRLTTPDSRAFTLLELVIVVVVIGVIAAIAVPRFGRTSQTSQAKSAAYSLRVVNEAVDFFKLDHGFYPGWDNDYGTGSVTQFFFRPQLITATNAAGTDVLPTPFGPYIRTFPKNPYNNNNSFVLIYSGTTSTKHTGYGWLLDTNTWSFNINLWNGGSPVSPAPLADVIQEASPAQIIYGDHPFD